MTDLGIPGVGDATLIASGGSALVYRAASSTGQEVAVKLLRGIRGKEVSRRFEREQSAADRLAGHPHIIEVLHSGVTEAGEPYLVMPLIAAGSLNDELEHHGAFALLKATSDVAMACDALEFAHQRGVLHRDIKPANLLRAEDGSIIVTDFGIARVVDAGITSATVGASTPLYAAPEILTENDASVRSEVYALGALLYALLHGRPAFSDTENIWATMNRIRTESPPPIVGVPEPVMRVINQAMAKDPGDRPASASLFRDNLRTALGADASWTPPQPAPTREYSRETDSLGPGTPETPGIVDTPNAAPPAPALRRPAPAVGPRPRRDSTAPKVILALAGLALVAGFAWWGTTRLLDRTTLDTETVVAPPVDNSLPSPGQTDDPDTGGDNGDNGETDADDANTPVTDAPATAPGDDEISIDDLPLLPNGPTTFVKFEGDFFSALLPEGWSLASRDVDEGYGYRSTFVADGMYLNVDTTPSEQRDGTGDIAQSARDIASGISSASAVRTEEVDGLAMHSFTFRNRQGVDSIDIFFEVDGDGYAVVAGSAADPDTAFAVARLVALSIRSNP